MARSRNIKPAFFDNDELAELEPLARLLFIGMWTIADFKGDFQWREKRVKAKLLPYDNCDIKKLAINLDKSGFIRFYSDGDLTYCNIVNFSLHQNPHKNERLKGSDIPEYSEELRQDVDLKGLAINLDKSGFKQNDSDTNRADSLNLIPDSCNPIKDLDQSAIDRCFDTFWNSGIRKVNKKKSKSLFNKYLKTEAKSEGIPIYDLTSRLIKDIKLRINSNQLGFSEMHPTTYLNGERWKDEIKAPEKKSNPAIYSASHKIYEPPELGRSREDLQQLGQQRIREIK